MGLLMTAKQPNLFKRSFGFLFLTFILSYGTFWYVERLFLENVLKKIFRESQKQGINISYSHMKAGGFPENLTFTLKQVHIQTNGVRLRIPSVSIEAGVLFPLKSQFKIHAEDTPWVFFSGYRGKGSHLRGNVKLEHFQFKEVAVNIGSLLLLKDKSPVLKISKGHMDCQLNQTAQSPSSLQARICGNFETWPKELALQANTTFRIETRFHISHIHQLIQKDGLNTWKQQRASIEIEDFSLIFPRMDFSWNGRLFVDEQHQFGGDFTLTMQGFQRFLDLLSRYGVGERDLTFLKVSLVFLKQNKDGSLSFPFKLRNNRFYMLGLALPFTIDDLLTQAP